ncbi:MAG: hypothetical protein WCV86_04885 [Patescibacteria group bacterium]|jgi:hypothetical protein
MGDTSTVQKRPIVGKEVLARAICEQFKDDAAPMHLPEARMMVDTVLGAVEQQLVAGNDIRFIGLGIIEVKDGVPQFRPADALQAAIIAATNPPPAKDGDAKEPAKDGDAEQPVGEGTTETEGDGAPATETEPVTAESNADPPAEEVAGSEEDGTAEPAASEPEAAGEGEPPTDPPEEAAPAEESASEDGDAEPAASEPVAGEIVDPGSQAPAIQVGAKDTPVEVGEKAQAVGATEGAES